jgi:hypothetical protein
MCIRLLTIAAVEIKPIINTGLQDNQPASRLSLEVCRQCVTVHKSITSDNTRIGTVGQNVQKRSLCREHNEQPQSPQS